MLQSDGLASRIAHKATSIAGVLVIALMVVQLVIVVLRYVFSFGVAWAGDLVIYLFMLASILPLVSVVLENSVVRVDVFYEHYSPSTKAIIDRVALGLLLAPAAGYAAYVSWLPMLNSWRLLESSPTPDGLPGYFLLKTFLMLAFAALAACAVVLALRRVPWKQSSAHEKELS